MTTSLLPPNATPLERALEAAVARIGDVPAPLAQLWDPHAIRADLLPWLAWGLSVDGWDAEWNEAEKRAVVAGAIEAHRRKGTRASVEAVLARFDALLQVVEWHQATPRAQPHTFEILLPLAGDDVPAGGKRATAAFAAAIVREVTRVKPVREHFRLIQSLTVRGAIGIQGVARTTIAARAGMAATFDTSPAWATYLLTEDGEPLQDDTGAFLDITP